MPITSIDDYVNSRKQWLLQKKTASITTVAGAIFSVHAQAGIPGAGTLAGTSTAAGVVPTDADAGYPVISSFVGTKGYLTRASVTNDRNSVVYFVDVLFKAGAYAFNASQTLTGQPSYASRVPNGLYGGLEIWLEAVTAFTGNQSIRIVYTDGDDVSRDTGVIATGVAPTVGRCYRVPLVGGGNGVKRINQVISSVSTAGTFNGLVVRPLLRSRVPVAYYVEDFDLYKTGLQEVYADSALAVYVQPDSTASGVPDVQFEIADN